MSWKEVTDLGLAALRLWRIAVAARSIISVTSTDDVEKSSTAQ
jgi:hypothetical protein